MSTDFMPVVTDLPYTIPSSVNEQISRLSKTIGLPEGLMKGKGLQGVHILCGVIIYRHLDRHQKPQVMALIRNLNDPRAVGFLVGKVVDTIVNPNWGLWSLTNKELEAKRSFHSALDNIMTTLGAGASVSSVTSIAKSSWSKRSLMNSKNVLLIIVWGGIWYSKQILKETQQEIDSRKSFNKTPFH